jgi:hypothetical protein
MGERRRRRRRRRRRDEEEEQRQLQLRQWYFDKLKRGLVMTVPELKAQAKVLGIHRTRKQLSDLRFEWEFLALRTPYRRKKGYVGPQIEKLGVIFVDLCELYKKWKVFNGQKYYLLVAQDALSQKIAAVPLAGKGQRHWETAIQHMVEKDFPLVRCFVSDADASVTGKAFQQRMWDKYSVKWHFVLNRNKVKRVLFFSLFLLSYISAISCCCRVFAQSL